MVSKRTRGHPEQLCQDPYHRPVHDQALGGEGPWDKARPSSGLSSGRERELGASPPPGIAGGNTASHNSPWGGGGHGTAFLGRGQ